MSNSIFNILGGQKTVNNGGDFSTAFQQFKSMFTGNPQETVQRLLSTGQMSQAHFNELSQRANQLFSILK